MRRFHFVFGLGLFCGVAAALTFSSRAAHAKEEAAPDLPPLPADCMPSSEVRPGMIGIGKTVFQGFKPGEFKAEILGVQRSAMAHGNMIVAKLSGPLLEMHGVVAGMSGSPVFVNGKTIGAVAYGWSYAYKPYCGITPIESMWSVWQAIGRKGLTQADQDAGDVALLGAHAMSADGTAWDWKKEWQPYKDRVDGKAEPLDDGLSFRPELPELQNMPGELKPLDSPLYLSGGTPEMEARLRRWFAPEGLDVMETGGMMGSAADAGANLHDPAPPLEDGSGLGIPLVTGDLSLGAIGTVTYRRGDKLIAFGHPMFGRGGLKAPMSATYIFGFMQSYERSFKLGETREEVGVVDQDRLFAIGGQFGVKAERIPVTIKVTGTAAFRPREYHYSVWNDEKEVPALVLELLSQAYSGSVSEGGRMTSHMHAMLRLADGHTLEKDFLGNGEGTAAIGDAADTTLLDLFLLLNNPFHKAAFSEVNIGIDVTPGMRNDDFIDLQAEHAQYLPGETVHMTGRFRPYRGEDYERGFDVKLPPSLEAGNYVIHLTDAEGTLRVRRGNDPALFNPRNYEEVVNMMQANAPETAALHLWLFKPSAGVAIEGQSLMGVPQSMADVITATTPADKLDQPVGKLLMDEAYPIAAPVEGSESAVIQVVDHINE